MADKVVVVRLRAAVGEYTSGLARAGGQAITFGGQLAGAAGRQDAAMATARTNMANLATGAVVAGKLMLAGIGLGIAVVSFSRREKREALAVVAVFGGLLLLSLLSVLTLLIAVGNESPGSIFENAVLKRVEAFPRCRHRRVSNAVAHTLLRDKESERG